MQLKRKYDKGVRFLFCVIYIFNKYAWVVPMNSKKGITIMSQTKFYNTSAKLRLQDNGIKFIQHRMKVLLLKDLLEP